MQISGDWLQRKHASFLGGAIELYTQMRKPEKYLNVLQFRCARQIFRIFEHGKGLKSAIEANNNVSKNKSASTGFQWPPVPIMLEMQRVFLGK